MDDGINWTVSTNGGEKYRLRSDPYKNEKGQIVMPLEDGTDKVVEGDFYLKDLKFGNLDYSCQESITIEMTKRYS